MLRFTALEIQSGGSLVGRAGHPSPLPPVRSTRRTLIVIRIERHKGKDKHQHENDEKVRNKEAELAALEVLARARALRCVVARERDGTERMLALEAARAARLAGLEAARTLTRRGWRRRGGRGGGRDREDARSGLWHLLHLRAPAAVELGPDLA